MMSKVFIAFTISFLGLASVTIAQPTSKGINYQGYAIDNDGKAIGSAYIMVKFTIEPGGFVEEVETQTNFIGQFEAAVGISSQTKNKEFANLDFQKKGTTFSLKVEVKEKVGGAYVTITNEPLRTVPYALNAENGVPVGTVVAYAGDNVPVGWLLCDGKEYTNSDYPKLFSVISSSFGGNGANFNVPDYRGVFLKGGSTDSEVLNALVIPFKTAKPHNNFAVDTIPGHAHGYSYDNNGSHVLKQADDEDPFSSRYGMITPGHTVIDVKTAESGEHSHFLSGVHDTRPYNAAVIYIIKY